MRMDDLGLELKFAGGAPTLTDTNLVEGYASLFGLADQGNDMVMPGAYAASLARMAARGDKVRMLWQHDPGQPIGIWDEVREDGQTLWRKASSIPLLVQARPQERLKSERTQLFAIGVAVVLGIFSFLLLMSGSMIGILLALLTSAILMRVMYSAFKPPKRAR